MAERGSPSAAGRLAAQLTSQLRLGASGGSAAAVEAAAGSSSSSPVAASAPARGGGGSSAWGGLGGGLQVPQRAGSPVLPPAREHPGKGAAGAAEGAEGGGGGPAQALAGSRLLHLAGASLSSNHLARSSLQAMLRQSLQERPGGQLPS
jgi:hypothetical protein